MDTMKAVENVYLVHQHVSTVSILQHAYNVLLQIFTMKENVFKVVLTRPISQLLPHNVCHVEKIVTPAYHHFNVNNVYNLTYYLKDNVRAFVLKEHIQTVWNAYIALILV